MNTDPDRDWTQFDDPRFELRWKYPDRTPRGAQVTHRAAERDSVLRVHFVSEPPGKVYFEVTSFPDLAPADEYRRHREYLETDRAAAVSELEPLSEGNLEGWTYSLRLPDRERVVLLLPWKQGCYRILYDPASPLNQHIVSTVEWRP